MTILTILKLFHFLYMLYPSWKYDSNRKGGFTYFRILIETIILIYHSSKNLMGSEQTDVANILWRNRDLKLPKNSM